MRAPDEDDQGNGNVLHHGQLIPWHFTAATDSVKDEVTGLVWERAVPATLYLWADAVPYCQGLSLPGFSTGWRLPSVKELASIVDSGRRACILLRLRLWVIRRVRTQCHRYEEKQEQ